MHQLKTYIVIIASFLMSWNASAKLRIVGVDPVNGVVVLKSYYSSDININQFALSFEQTDTIAGKLKILSGDTIVKSKGFVSLRVTGLNYSHGFIALHDLRFNQKIGSYNGLTDYMQWGSAGHRFEDLADTTYYLILDTVSMKYDTVPRWRKGTYISTAGPFSFTGGSVQCGVQYWTSYKLPALGVKIVSVIPSLDIIKLRNIGASNVDLSALIICAGDRCVDSIKQLTIIKGKLNLLKNDTIVLTGLGLNDTIDNLSIFFPLSIKDTVNLVDFVQWGGYAAGYSAVAHFKGYADSSTFIPSLPNDTLYYIGNNTRTQYGPAFWSAYHYVADTTSDTLGVYGVSPATEISIFPNPSTDCVYIKGLGSQSHRLIIYNQLGEALLEKNIYHDTQISIADYPSGMYVISISSSNIAAVNKKLIIKHK